MRGEISNINAQNILQGLVGGSLLVMLSLGIGYSEPPSKSANIEVETSTFAGGCFWCMEPPFDELDGVISTTVGYAGGHTENPTYEEVSAGVTGHTEAVQIGYDPERVSYQDLFDVFWRNIDPLDANGQFCDKGSQYRTAIFYHDPDQKRLAEESKKKLEESKPFEKTIVTEIIPLSEFYAAEDYHQDYYRKNPVRYEFYRYTCGRDNRLQQLWGSS